MPEEIENLIKQGESQNIEFEFKDFLILEREIRETGLSTDYADCNNS